MTAALVEDDDRRWWHSAACVDVDDEDGRPFIARGPIAQRRICKGCPVKSECLDEALAVEADDPALPSVGWPVRGGMLGQERRALILKSGTRDARRHRHIRRSDLTGEAS